MARTSQDDNGHDGLAGGPEGDKPMSFLDHVGELRTRLIMMALGITVGFFAAFYFVAEISEFLRLPLHAAWTASGHEGTPVLQALQIQDPLMVDVRVAVTAGIFLTAPWLFWQVWLFIAPGLYAREKRFTIPFVICSVLMFLGGAGFSFKIVLPFIYEYMITYSEGRGEAIQLELNNYFKGTTRVLLVFGMIFEFPLLVAFLAKAKIITEQVLLKFWKIAVVLMFIVAGILTPPEPISQIMMAGPMCVLYFISIGVAWAINPESKVAAARAKLEAENAALDDDDDDAP